MAVKLRLKRMGAKKRPFYRIVAADSRSPRDGRFIETVGTYNPIMEPAEVKINEEVALKWLDRGAIPSDTVRSLLKNEGITALMVTHDISEAIAMSDKIIVLTHRPAKIKAVHEIDFEIKNRTPLNCRQSPKFSKYFDMMWSELNEKETKEKNNKI